jgi:hypothetical protein
MDARLKIASGCIVVGPSQSGKTEWCKKLLLCSKDVFDEKINKIYWYYGAWNRGLVKINEMKIEDKEGERVVILIREGMPEKMNEIEPNSIVIVDDSMGEDFAKIFSVWPHHVPCFICKVTQNLFHKRADRSTNINSQYIVFMNNPGDLNSVQTVATHMRKPWISDVMRDEISSDPYGYLFLDLRQETPDIIRVRTNIFSSIITVFIKGKSRKRRYDE